MANWLLYPEYGIMVFTRAKLLVLTVYTKTYDLKALYHAIRCNEFLMS